MRKSETPLLRRSVAWITLTLFAWSGIGAAQAPPPPAYPVLPPPASGAVATPAPGGKTFSQQELDQLVAPVALYPDALVAQILMASTYPLEIVSAERWVRANPNLKDKALEDALQNQSWDASVKSLTVFPQVLTMMSQKLDWTQKLGDAFLAQQKELMDAIQGLRQKAAAEGNLKDSKEQKVVTEKVESTTIIRIEPSDPEVVYVPTYDPTVVYGAWPYPAFPPYYYYPPGYAAGAALIGSTVGIIVGGALWGGCNWGRGDVNINVNRYINFNRTNISNGGWQHRPEHRGAVPYRDKGVAQQYNRGQSPGAEGRDQYRGRTDAGGVQGSRDPGSGLGSERGRSPSTTQTPGAVSNRDLSGTRNSSAFDTGSRAQTRDFSSRGTSSINSSRSFGEAGGGARVGGGGRGGGGRR